MYIFEKKYIVMSKKNEMVVTDEMAFNDMRTFLETMKLRSDRIDKFVGDQAVKDFIPKFFKDGTLRLEDETNCLIQTLDDGKEIKIHPARPTMRDLNLVKPPNYDKLDAENRDLVNISFLTKIPFRSLQEDYLSSDLEFCRNMCLFF